MCNSCSQLHNAILLSCLFLLIASGIAACGGASTETTPPAASNTVITSSSAPVYTGPPPASTDIQAFKLNVWDNLAGQNRCGTCHGSGGQSPTFVQDDDINQAYAAAVTIADLANPGNSRMVAKVAGGHNCWLSSDIA
ncbi:MAG TPA: LamG domain-containing protein, partial [Gammaproteobacteria bacterium]|nr:LamG domain-containing protein [Gammaproteobacteria bacterium]